MGVPTYYDVTMIKSYVSNFYVGMAVEKNGRRYNIAIQNVAKIISVVEALYAILTVCLGYVTKCWFHMYMRSVHHVSRRGWPESSSYTEMFFFLLSFFVSFFPFFN